ncbi:MAG: right-handed parallel beta-helix repeat-containing protein [Alphaproteobacteria bacterium]
MADIRIKDLPADTSPAATDVVAIDGATTRKSTLAEIVSTGRPMATQAEAEAGVDPLAAMSPLTTKQAIDALGGVQFATTAQGTKADTALQPAAIGTTVQAYNDMLSSVAGLSYSNGDLIYANGAASMTRLPIAPNGYFLMSDGSTPVWSSSGPTGMLASVYDPQNISSDVFDRANHTGTQAISTVSGLQGALDAKATAFPAKSAAEAYAPSAAPDFIRLAGYTSAGDGGGALYKKVGAEPSHAGKLSITLSDAVTVVWYEIAESVLTHKMLGAIGNGTVGAATGADDTTAVQNVFAVAAATGAIMVDGQGSVYRITAGATITYPVIHANATYVPDIGLDPVNLFAINSSGVVTRDVTVDADGMTYTPATTGSRFAFITNTDEVRREGIYFERVKVRNLLYRATSGTPLGDLDVAHAIRIQHVDWFEVHDCEIEGISGYAIFTIECSHGSILRNDVLNAVWYPICCYGAVSDVEIAHNKVDGDDIYYGGGINLQGAFPYDRIRNIDIHDNVLSGSYGYGQVIRGGSCDNVRVYRNKIRNWGVSQYAFSTTYVGIYFYARGVTATTIAQDVTVTTPVNGISITPVTGLTLAAGVPYEVRLGSEIVTIVAANANSPTDAVNITQRGLLGTTATTHSSGAVLTDNNGPCHDIWVEDNEIEAPHTVGIATDLVAIELDNPRTPVRDPSYNNVIRGNRLKPSSDGAVHWNDAVIINGDVGGYNGVVVVDNSGDIDATSTAGGAVLTKATSANGLVSNVWIDKNRFRNVAAGNAATMRGVLLESHTELVNFGVNTFDGFYTSVYVAAGCSSDVRRGSQITLNPKSGGVEYRLLGTLLPSGGLRARAALAAYPTTGTFGQVEAEAAGDASYMRTALYSRSDTLRGGVQALQDATAFKVFELNPLGGDVHAGQPTSLTSAPRGSMNLEGILGIDGVKVVGNRIAGWGDPTGTDTRTAFATSTVTTEQLAERVMALILDLKAHGLLGP